MPRNNVPSSLLRIGSDTGFLYMLLSDESVEGELLLDESAGRDVDRVLYELQWLHLWPIT
jgi:hypothetical protein